jgi:hypothetical protein
MSPVAVKRWVGWFATLALVWSQSLAPVGFRLQRLGTAGLIAGEGLRSNVVSEIRLQGDSAVWVGTGLGLAVLRDSTTVTALDTLTLSGGTTALLRDGISAIAVQGDTVVVAAATDDGDIPVGAGLYLTLNAGDSLLIWTYFDQPVDEPGDSLAPFADRFFRALPITTAHANVTYDAAIAGNYIWITSWAGGLRRYDLVNKVWDRIPLPEDDQAFLVTCADSAYQSDGGESVLKNLYLNPRDPQDGGNHNHKAFSVLAYGDTVWVGTADGINRGIIGPNGCVDWVHYAYPTSGITGNFVVGLGRQDWHGRRIIWAVTVNTDDPGEQRGLSYTVDDGETWFATLVGERIYNVVAGDSIVLAASERGLWKSEDGQTWALFKPARDATPLTSDEILSNTVYSVALDTRSYYPQPVLWIGTPDGLARSSDLDGSTWTIFRANYDPQKVYVYPNPFSPYIHNIRGGDGYVRIHTDVKESFVIEMAVYNFAMEQVYRTEFDRRLGDGTLKWNGRDSQGRLVANGTYFIRLDYDLKTEWIKLVVLK